MFPIVYNQSWYRRAWLDPRQPKPPGLAARLLTLLDGLATAGAKDNKDPVPLFPPF